ncbi:hypothetical protein B1748_35850 [Paenibacillus sp. MY03]|uniref:hypothetical protein n=1 Tax=Paenibacillus sp. MY03 TaxID=302980 RepID=UPI000B3C984C|nr:hypothetical protein [Paenibacillus sp. MY03]OUS67692.1 hypothetical protein B1748_35850 [Paenibacillus sp. MY03]
MYTVTVPIALNTITEQSKEVMIKRLRQLNANEVYLIPLTVDKLEENCVLIRSLLPFFTHHRIETAVWVGGSLAHYQYADPYDKIVDIEGEPSKRVCPLDKQFQLFFCDLFRQIAQTGVRKIALDDDYRINWVNTPPSCFCPKHMALYSEILGREISLDTMREQIYSNNPGEYRDAWLKGSQISLCNLASAVRSTVDEIDPSINIVLSSGPAHWGADGASALDLATILAGNNAKELRLSGAAFWGQRVSSAMDFARKQAAFCKQHHIRTIAEADAYPRPRHAGPAYGVEFIDLIARADGNFHGVLKYGFDYTSSPNYEPGYARLAEKNRELHRQTEEMFADKTAQGIYLFEPMHLNWHITEVSRRPEADVMWSPGVAFLNDNSIPAVFEPGGVNLVFGQNAQLLDRQLLNNGTILDYTAARILTEAGVDVGIAQFNEKRNEAITNVFSGNYEYYYREQEKVALFGNVIVHRLSHKEGVKLLSEIFVNNETLPGAYWYENADKQRFLVYPFDAYPNKSIAGLFRSYCRQRQLIQSNEWLSGRKLDAVCSGNPDLYMIVKKNEHSLAVGLWNLFPDRIDEPVIELADDFKEIEFINGSGQLMGRTVRLDSPLHAFDYCAFKVTK